MPGLWLLIKSKIVICDCILLCLDVVIVVTTLVRRGDAIHLLRRQQRHRRPIVCSQHLRVMPPAGTIHFQLFVVVQAARRAVLPPARRTFGASVLLLEAVGDSSERRPDALPGLAQVSRCFEAGVAGNLRRPIV